MKDKLKRMITNQFAWNVAAAICGIILVGCYLTSGEEILAILWAIISGCNIAMAWLNKNKE